MRVGLIGLGAIGQGVTRLVQEGAGGEVAIVGALVRDVARTRPVTVPKVVATLEDLLAERPEVVVEAGGHAALRAYGARVLGAGCDLIIVSVGALAEPGVEDELVAAARAGGGRARVASGAIGALDAIAAAAVGGLTRLTHTTRKPARTLLDADEAARMATPREIFRGTAREGALKFPESINVAAAVSLAGLGLDRTEVRVIADPALERNRHEVVAEGAFGTLRFEIEGIPSDENPRTGRLVAMSIVHTLRQRHAPLTIG